MPRSTATPGNTIATGKTAGVSGDVQTVVSVTPKDFFPTVVRSGITAPDVGAGTMDPTSVGAGLIPTSDSSWLVIAGVSNTPNVTLNFLLVSYDEAGFPLGVSQIYSLTTGPTYVSGPNYISVGPQTVVDVNAATTVVLLVTSLTGTWTLYCKRF